jgi:hypothetical protein
LGGAKSRETATSLLYPDLFPEESNARILKYRVEVAPSGTVIVWVVVYSEAEETYGIVANNVAVPPAVLAIYNSHPPISLGEGRVCCQAKLSVLFPASTIPENRQQITKITETNNIKNAFISTPLYLLLYINK